MVFLGYTAAFVLLIPSKLCFSCGALSTPPPKEQCMIRLQASRTKHPLCCASNGRKTKGKQIHYCKSNPCNRQGGKLCGRQRRGKKYAETFAGNFGGRCESSAEIMRSFFKTLRKNSTREIGKIPKTATVIWFVKKLFDFYLEIMNIENFLELSIKYGKIGCK